VQEEEEGQGEVMETLKAGTIVIGAVGCRCGNNEYTVVGFKCEYSTSKRGRIARAYDIVCNKCKRNSIYIEDVKE
jgi:hypothetical protein